MIALNIPTPPAKLERVNVLRLFPPLVAEEQYSGILKRQEGNFLACAIVHPYRTAHLYAGAFNALLPQMQRELWPKQKLAEMVWADIVYTSSKGSRPKLIVRTARIESGDDEIIWHNRDSSYVRTWEWRVEPVVTVLDRIRE
jgi:hypothetical protein